MPTRLFFCDTAKASGTRERFTDGRRGPSRGGKAHEAGVFEAGGLVLMRRILGAQEGDPYLVITLDEMDLMWIPVILLASQ